VLITVDLATFFQVWLGQTDSHAALKEGLVEIKAIPALAGAFPAWFAYSHAAPTIRSITAELQLANSAS
jgi:hypothetical protein